MDNPRSVLSFSFHIKMFCIRNMAIKQVVLCFLLEVFLKCYADTVIPKITLTAYSPKGFKASIPAQKGIWLFAFHGNLNKEILRDDSGEFGGNLQQPTNNTLSYFNEDLTLKPGDTVHYWVVIHYQKEAYRIVDEWIVPKLVDEICKNSSSVVAEKFSVCVGDKILEDNFDGDKIDDRKWLVEEFIPLNSKDYEFVSYQNRPDICYIQSGKLFITPKPAQNESEVQGTLNFRKSCTRQTTLECFYVSLFYFILPPVTSGRIVSLVNFRYGKVEIKAKLPAGDWIYPQIYLEEFSDPSRKLWIAYSRGNVHYKASNGEDIGGHLLFGGPVLDSTEPARSTYLRTKYDAKEPFSRQMHTYTAIWTKDSISLQLDGIEYGQISKTEMSNIGFGENSLVRLVLGVGVGGINDFPDDFSTGEDATKKPWKNKERKQVKNFFEARDKWGKSWVGDNAALQIENIEITAL